MKEMLTIVPRAKTRGPVFLPFLSRHEKSKVGPRVFARGTIVSHRFLLKNNSTSTDQGFILVMVLILIAFMALALGTFSLWVNKEMTISKSLKKRAEVETTAFSLKQNILYMLGTTPMTVRGLDFEPEPEGVVKKETEANASFVSLFNKPYKFGDLEVHFQDEGGLLNLAGLSQPDMKKLIKKFGVEETEFDGLMAKLKDYVSPNETGTQKSAGGASADEYKEAELPPPPFEKLRTPWELKRVLGWRDIPAFFEKDALPRILTTAEPGKINLNTAPAPVLDFVPNMKPKIKQFLLDKRKEEKPYIEKLSDITQTTGENFPTSMKVGLFPSRTQRVTIASKQVSFNTQFSVTQTPNDQKTPWRINFEVELAGPPPVVKKQDDAGVESEVPVFPDPALLSTKK